MRSPRYQDISAADVPEVTDDDGTTVRIVCGECWGRRGPVDHIAAKPRYLDVSIPPGVRRRIPVDRTHHAFAYVFAGAGAFRDASEPQAILTEDATDAMAQPLYQASNRTLVLFDPCDEVTVEAGESGLRFLLVSGAPFAEPVAWRGPIVMNTPEELREAYAQLRDGTFIAAT
jgi:redox-sensitive bicupin YhaK (pirin superfamily)